MAEGGFTVTTYRVLQGYRQGVGDSEGPQATLTLYGPLEGGVQKWASLVFVTVTDLFGNVYMPDERVVATLPYDMFRPMYDLLRHEAPVKAYYRYDDEFRQLYWIDLRTDATEAPGEGPADANVVRSLMRSMRNLLPRSPWAGRAKPGGRLVLPTFEDHPSPEQPGTTRI